MLDEVPRAQMYYVMAENDSSEVLRLAEHRVSVSCALNLSSSHLEGEVKPEDSVSQTSRSKKKSSSTNASSAPLKAAVRKAALMARAQVLNDGFELKRRRLELQHDQEQLNLRAKISEVEAEERVYQMFEERDTWSDDISPVKCSVKKSPPNPNVAESSACALSERKNALSSMQDRGASVKEKKEICSAEEVGVNVRLEEQNPLQGEVQNVGLSYTLPD